jgi:hypothetical protein
VLRQNKGYIDGEFLKNTLMTRGDAFRPEEVTELLVRRPLVQGQNWMHAAETQWDASGGHLRRIQRRLWSDAAPNVTSASPWCAEAGSLAAIPLFLASTTASSTGVHRVIVPLLLSAVHQLPLSPDTPPVRRGAGRLAGDSGR